ncbi:hypothetical protein NHJ13734_009426 [Beauveria thailandica]
MAAGQNSLPADTPVVLTGAQETLLITLRAKYQDFSHPRPPPCGPLGRRRAQPLRPATAHPVRAPGPHHSAAHAHPHHR